MVLSKEHIKVRQSQIQRRIFLLVQFKRGSRSTKNKKTRKMILLLIDFKKHQFTVDKPIYNISFMDQLQKVDPNDLLIIITTSPIQSNPATYIIDQAINSIKMQPSLDNVSIIIICDGVKLTQEKTSRYKSGIVSTQSLQNYEIYKKNLKQKYESNKNITIIQRQERYCFAENIRYVMTISPQPFVLIFQHDHVFLRKIDLQKIVKTMKQHPINYVGFTNKSVDTVPVIMFQNLKLRNYFWNKLEEKITQQQFQSNLIQHHRKLYGLPLLPLIFWYDKIHIARKSYYLDVIFNKKGFYNEITKSYQKTLSFVQDSFGTATKNAILKRPQKFQQLRAFLYWDKDEHAILHIHGRGWITQQMREQIIQKNLEEKEPSESSEEKEFEENCIDIFGQN